MDTTTPTSPTPSTPPSSTPVTPPNPANFNSSPQVVQSGGMMKKVMIGLGVLVVLAAIGGGAYYYMNMNSKQTSDSRTPVVTYTPAPSPTTQPDSLEQQANQVNEQPVESDLKAVDQDINNLKNSTASATPASK